ncbi:HDOD domain-containing protein [Gemmatimonas sp.]|uniref:HDOD domain-containing protein n=1 Tax=Gemmatimonas sp. TaxID=1962908 RepID=UPI00356AEB3F
MTPKRAVSLDANVASATRRDVPASAVPDGPSLQQIWQARLSDAMELQRSHPIAARQPDAAALLLLLQDGPDVVIRQLPAAARDAMALCNDDRLSRAEVAARLSTDPALVQGLLRTANSTAFASGLGTVIGIDQAIDRIGQSGARAVILASCVDGLLSHPGGEFNAMAASVWSHMVRTGPLARVIAPAFAADGDEAFSIAMLHDVGKLIIFDRISVLRASRRRQIEVDSGFAHALLQLLHEPLGALAAQRWEMGARAASAIAGHHRLEASGTRDSLAEVMFVAEQADHAARRGQTLDLDVLWSQGRLTGSPARVSGALQQSLALV